MQHAVKRTQLSACVTSQCKTDFPNSYKLQTSFDAVEMYSPNFPNFYKTPTRFAVDKTHSNNLYIHALWLTKRTPHLLYKIPTTSVAVQTDSPNLYKPTTRFKSEPALRTSTRSYKIIHAFRLTKRTTWFSTRSQQLFLQSKRTPRTFTNFQHALR